MNFTVIDHETLRCDECGRTWRPDPYDTLSEQMNDLETFRECHSSDDHEEETRE